MAQEGGKKPISLETSSDEWLSALAIRDLTGAQTVDAALAMPANVVGKCIERKIDKHPNIACRGRGFDQNPIDYDPKAAGPTSILSRWAHIQATENSISNLEALLRPFVTWNRLAFPNLREAVQLDEIGGENSRAGVKRAHAPVWKWHESAHRLLISPDGFNPDEVVQALVLDMRRKCESVDPNSILLQDPEQAADHHEWDPYEDEQKLQEWSLFDVKLGFGAQLARIFDTKGLNVKQYAERIEKRLQAYRAANPTAVQGHPK